MKSPQSLLKFLSEKKLNAEITGKYAAKAALMSRRITRMPASGRIAGNSFNKNGMNAQGGDAGKDLVC